MTLPRTNTERGPQLDLVTIRVSPDERLKLLHAVSMRRLHYLAEGRPDLAQRYSDLYVKVRDSR